MGGEDPTKAAPGEAGGIATGVEQVLLRARDEPEFLADLERRRSEAVRDAGIDLSATEAAMLDSIEPDTIARMVANLPAGGLSSVDAIPVTASQGIRPDLPGPSRGLGAETPGGPSFDPVRGTRTGVKVAVATGVVLAAGAGALLCVTAGNRPDLPPAAAGPGSPSANGGEDDADPDGG